MTWTAFRRRRTAVVVFLIASLALDVWMVVNRHASAEALRRAGCAPTVACVQPTGLFAPARQAVIIDALLWLLPLALGLVLGVGLVAGETERSTHRLTWTQGASRTRWYLTSLGVAVIGALVVVGVALAVAHWWTGNAWVDLPDQLSLGGSRIQPNLFAVSGVVPLAYTVFAVAFGGMTGALFRRVPWASAVTVAVYGLLALVMATTVRPTFTTTGFHPDDTTDSVQYVNWPQPPPWVLHYEIRAVPGAARGPRAPSPAVAAAGCSPFGYDLGRLLTCLNHRGVEGGFVTVAPDNYWRLQWPEALLYAGFAVVVSGIGLVAVRRMQD